MTDNKELALPGSTEITNDSKLPDSMRTEIEKSHVQQALNRETHNTKKVFMYTMIKRAIIHASNGNKIDDTIRLEMYDGRVVTVRGQWGSAEVTDSRKEGN